MEVFLTGDRCIWMEEGLLHVRGGVSLNWLTKRARCKVFSTSVEVFLPRSNLLSFRKRLLHVRGGVSRLAERTHQPVASSPRPWRCFRPNRCVSAVDDVFSTSVEVFPCQRNRTSNRSGLLHVRGGVSGGGTVKAPAATVFSTSVEVFEYFGSWRGCCLLT